MTQYIREKTRNRSAIVILFLGTAQRLKKEAYLYATKKTSRICYQH